MLSAPCSAIFSLVRRRALSYKTIPKLKLHIIRQVENFGTVRKGQIPSYSRIYKTDVDIWGHSREGKPIF